MADEETKIPLGEIARREKPGLERAGDGGRMQADLERALADKLMAPSDMGASLTRAFEESASLGLPTLTDIDRALSSAEVRTLESRQDIEQLLSIDTLGNIAVEGMKLNQLLSRGGMSIEERSILRTGLQFMRRAMYEEAVEWWTLNSPNDQFSRFDCLLRLLLALTYKFAGDQASADAAIASVKKNSKFDLLDRKI